MEAELLKRSIEEALIRDERLSAREVAVHASDGAVTLSGTVQSFRRKLAAKSIAERVCGDRAVVFDRLEVHAAEPQTDERIAEAVRAALEADDEALAAAIAVAVSAGYVTISGAVSSERERHVAQDAALSAPGVRGVQNLLEISQQARAEAAVVSREILYELEKAPALDGADLRFAISGDVGVLSGRVCATEQKAQAEALARLLWAGRLRNEIEIEGLSGL